MRLFAGAGFMALLFTSTVHAQPEPDAGEVHLTLGATLRLRQEVLSQPGLGLLGEPHDDFTTLRALVHADLHATAYARAFLELGSMWAFGRSLPERSIDENRLDVQQSFVDLAPFPEPSPTRPWRITLRAGRQTFALGSSRLVGIRDGPNVRRSFDGARLLFDGSLIDAQLIAVSSPSVAPGVLDDAPSLDELLFGLYVTLTCFEWLSADVYYLGYRSVDSAWLDATGRELRHSFGLRLSGRAGAFDYNDEAVVQLGSTGEANIVAWTVATDHGVTPVATRDVVVRVGARADLASGDGEPGDGTLGTFSPLFPKLPYFSELVLVSPSNMMDVHPMISVQLFETVHVELGVDLFWRHRERDGFYTSPNEPLLAPYAGRFTGTQLNAELELRATRELTLTLYASYFDVSAGLAAAGARDAGFFGFWSVWQL